MATRTERASASFFLLFFLLLALLATSAVAAGAHHHHLLLQWPACDGSVGECAGSGDEFELGSESSRRFLATTNYIGYDALHRDSVPCSRRGASYYNCRPGAQANPYSRGCSAITQCRSQILLFFFVVSCSCLLFVVKMNILASFTHSLGYVPKNPPCSLLTFLQWLLLRDLRVLPDLCIYCLIDLSVLFFFSASF